MAEAYVQRGEGLRPGPDIIDPLMATPLVLLERGRAEIDANSGLQKVYLTCVYRGGVQAGQLVEVHDSLQGETYRGKIVGAAYRARGNAVTLEITLLRKPVE